MNLNSLNDPQREAVLYQGGPLMIVAGAGSGKTTTLTSRVGYLIKVGEQIPSRLFVTTFTTKAASEMKDRLAQKKMIGERKAEQLNIGTFHSLCRTILMKVMEANNQDKPQLLSGGGRYFSMLNAFKSAKLHAGYTISALNQISLWKNEALSVGDLRLNSATAKEPFIEYYEVYERYMEENNRIDFDDMLYKCWVELMKPKNSLLLEKQRRRISHILVDEVQDLNKIQFHLIQLLAGQNRNITIVGDDFQGLYSFRGANIENLFDFRDWLQPHTIKLEQNYRSTKAIVAAGNVLIKKNEKQIAKELYSKNEDGIRPKVLVSFDPDHEADTVFSMIERLIVGEGYSLKDFAIIYRTNAQSRAVVDVLIYNQIPHRVHSKFGFYDRPEVLDILAYLRIVSNPYQAELGDFKRIINRPSRFIARNNLDEVEEFQLDQSIDTYWEAMVAYMTAGLATPKFAEFVSQIQDMYHRYKTKNSPPIELIRDVLDTTGYEAWLDSSDEEEQEPDNDRKSNLDSLLTGAGAGKFSDVDEYLAFIDGIDSQFEDEDDVINLMTIHKSKGLEFPIVFVIGASTRIMPHMRALDLEEERRCMYVAVTRAEDQAFISSIHGKYGRLNVTVSPFVHEMELDIPKLEERMIGGVQSFTIGSNLTPGPKA